MMDEKKGNTDLEVIGAISLQGNWLFSIVIVFGSLVTLLAVNFSFNPAFLLAELVLALFLVTAIVFSIISVHNLTSVIKNLMIDVYRLENEISRLKSDRKDNN